MTGPVLPAPTGSPENKPSEFPSADPTRAAPTSTKPPYMKNRAGLIAAAVVLVALIASYVVGALLFRSTGYRRGYAAGFASVGYYEGAAIADSMKAVARDTVFARAGLLPDSGQHGLWHVARFNLTPARAFCSYGSEPALDTMRLPVFSEHERAPVGRSYRGASGRLYHVDR
jgi:hypothetical protein